MTEDQALGPRPATQATSGYGRPLRGRYRRRVRLSGRADDYVPGRGARCRRIMRQASDLSGPRPGERAETALVLGGCLGWLRDFRTREFRVHGGRDVDGHELPVPRLQPRPSGDVPNSPRPAPVTPLGITFRYARPHAARRTLIQRCNARHAGEQGLRRPRARACAARGRPWPAVSQAVRSTSAQRRTGRVASGRGGGLAVAGPVLARCSAGWNSLPSSSNDEAVFGVATVTKAPGPVGLGEPGLPGAAPEPVGALDVAVIAELEQELRAARHALDDLADLGAPAESLARGDGHLQLRLADQVPGDPPGDKGDDIVQVVGRGTGSMIVSA